MKHRASDATVMNINDNPSGHAQRPGAILRRLARCRDGVSAIEFALIAVPFLMLLFAIIETALMFFAGQVLDNATNRVARQIRTGEAHQTNLSREQMIQTICSGMAGLPSCESRLHLDVRTYQNFDAVDLASPLDEDGNIRSLAFNYGKSADVVVVRAFYAWPPTFHLLSSSGGALADGSRLLGAIVAFRNEPFPW
jgi:Flp pilus assembly protein TadG